MVRLSTTAASAGTGPSTQDPLDNSAGRAGPIHDRPENARRGIAHPYPDHACGRGCSGYDVHAGFPRDDHVGRRGERDTQKRCAGFTGVFATSDAVVRLARGVGTITSDQGLITLAGKVRTTPTGWTMKARWKEPKSGESGDGHSRSSTKIIGRFTGNCVG